MAPLNNFKLAIAAAVALGSVAAAFYFYNKKEEKNQGFTRAVEKPKKSPLSLPVVEFSAFFEKENNPTRYAEECAKVADAFHRYGIVVIRDPRVAEGDNDRFLDLMERYFEHSDGVRDARPEYFYQVGVTPEFKERPRDHCKLKGAYGPDDQPLSVCPPELDPKWRFFWRSGPRPEKTDFPSVNMDQVIPPEFPEWKEVLDMWGGEMRSAIFTLAEMAAVGYGLKSDALTKLMEYGPHLLAPTGSNFNKYGAEGTVLAGFHYDLNFMTIHGKSRFPGLYIWTREGTRTAVTVPDGCLIVQAGKQFEYVTGGHVMAGFHEVVVSEQTRKVIERKAANGECLWRVSSTLFGHIASDNTLEPIGQFSTPETLAKYPPIKAGNQVTKELEAIKLNKPSS